jgi:cytoskeletal protein CcmA (bactofilin family)
MQHEPASIGKSIVIRGDVTGSEDLTVEGRVEGTIQLRDHTVAVGSTGQVQAHIVAKAIVVLGQVKGNLTAAEKVDIREKGSVEGDIVAPRVAIADGAEFRGSIDMRRDKTATVNDWAASRLDAADTAPVANGRGEHASV